MSEELVAPSQAAATSPTAGQLLKAARERQGMHISVLATSLKVSRRKLELIEADRYDELPDATFVRALASSMSRALKLDAATVLQGLPEAPTRLLDPSRGLNRPFRERESSAWTEGWDWSRPLSLPLVAALLLVGGGAALYFAPIEVTPPSLPSSAESGHPPAADAGSGSSGASPQGTNPAFPPSDAGTSAVAGPAAASASSASSPSAVASPSTPGTARAPAADAAPARAAASGSSSMAGSPLLGLRASETSWIEVRDARGEVLLARNLSAGESVSLDGALPLRVTVGNAAATQVSFRGQAVALAASTRENVARLELQ